MHKLLFAVMLAALPHHASAAEPEPVGVWVGPTGDRINLFGEQGKCPEGTKRTTYFVSDPRAKEALIPGCWAPIEIGLVCMAFEDGDRGCLRSKDFKWLPGMAPAKLARWM